MANKETKSVEVSHSQAKREERRKEVARARRTATTAKIVGYVVAVAIVALIAWGITSLIIKQSSRVQQSDDYSAGLDANGYISGIKASEKVNLPEYKGVKVPYNEIEYTDEEMQSDIDSLLYGYRYSSDDASLVVADGDTVTIDYAGTIDGVAFDGGTAENQELVIGSGTLVEGFEQQLIGAKNLTHVDVEVTFPEDYFKEELAGKPAVFAVDIKGIYTTPEFTDDFVAENLAATASTVDEYKAFIRAEREAENLNAWVETYLSENTTVNSYPKKYIKILKSIQKFDDMQSYQYMNEMYTQYLGYSYYNSFEEYIGMSEAEYDESLKDVAKETCKENMAYQAIVELEGAVVDADYYKAVLEAEGQGAAYYASQAASAGEPFVLQQAIKHKAIEIVADSAVIEK